MRDAHPVNGAEIVTIIGKCDLRITARPAESRFNLNAKGGPGDWERLTMGWGGVAAWHGRAVVGLLTAAVVLSACHDRCCDCNGNESSPVAEGGAAGGGSNKKCSFSAVHNWQPVDFPDLWVKGSCTMPTPGYKITLEQANPQGINPDILILKMTVTPPTGNVAQVITEQEIVPYVKGTKTKYKQVQIEPGGFMVKVVDVQ